MISTAIRITAAALLLGGVSVSAPGAPNAASPYAGQEHRAIKSLSADDIAQLRAGKGWGLAKPAELNGLPGPGHLLELKEELRLTAGQVRKVQALYDEMNARARALGERFIAAEARIEESFADASATAETLRALLRESERLRSELRFVHLSTHLRTPALLSREQVERYNTLRGYDGPGNEKTPGHGGPPADGSGSAKHGHAHR